MKFPRSSGVLLHITSLPGESLDDGGIGDLGPQAYRFVDFLKAAGQSVWQILPLSPPAEGNSPYSAYSAFAGNPLMVSLSRLVRDGLLSQVPELSPGEVGADHVDFALVAERKERSLARAFERFSGTDGHPLVVAFRDFCVAQADWLDEFARFEAIMRNQNERDWSKWPAELVARHPDVIADWDEMLADEIQFSKFKQFLFDRQWCELKAYANENGVRICGDMPIFVAHESADVWVNQNLFAVDEKGKPTLVAGVPPDYFSETGQLWGNPQYDWEALEATGYDWWVKRFGCALRQFDLLRVDHFRGFEAYWEIPASAKTAIEGAWKKGPMSAPFDAAERVLGELPFIAEDLGMITEEVHQLRLQLGFPGMRVLQFGFDTADDEFHRPNTYPEDSVAYTGTHDNETLVGWLKTRKPADSPDPLKAWITESEPVYWQLIDTVLQSRSDTAIVPMQDLLGLGNAARMNVPGQAKGNWSWRMSADAITDPITTKLKTLTNDAGRCE
ncbi:4-alpha-glucanotransferase [Neorhodopirellula lusitana]|uniref:4-alpha-glucanotransferase n=1 Tax=Neorhodopirellula lusitana TaxID=445327 RepID=UPI00384B7AD0